MALTLHQVHPLFVAEASGLDLRDPLDGATVSADDFIIWDNRYVLHRGRPYDLSQRRELTRTTTEDLVSAAEFAHLQPAHS